MIESHSAPGEAPQHETALPISACAPGAEARRLDTEQLRQWIAARRSTLRRERAALLQAAERLRQEIAACDQLLAELTV
jgi:hypothetical protein